MEGLERYPKVAQEIVTNSVPDLASNGFKIMNVEGYGSAMPYVTKGPIRVVFKEPNIIGLYSTSELHTT